MRRQTLITLGIGRMTTKTAQKNKATKAKNLMAGLTQEKAPKSKQSKKNPYIQFS